MDILDCGWCNDRGVRCNDEIWSVLILQAVLPLLEIWLHSTELLNLAEAAVFGDEHRKVERVLIPLHIKKLREGDLDGEGSRENKIGVCCWYCNEQGKCKAEAEEYDWNQEGGGLTISWIRFNLSNSPH